MIKYSEILHEVLNLYPEEIPCEDAFPVNGDGLNWQSATSIYDKIEEDNNYFEDSNEMLGALLWSALVGIDKGFKKEYVYQGKKCTGKVNVKNIIDLELTKRHFIETVEDPYWQNYLKKINEIILFDEYLIT